MSTDSIHGQRDPITPAMTENDPLGHGAQGGGTMSAALEAARAALADLRAGIPQRGDYPEYDREHEDLDKIAALIAEHERLSTRYDENIGAIDRLLAERAELKRLTTPPTDAEREALARLIADRRIWHGNATDMEDADAILASDVWRNRRQGPITDAEREALAQDIRIVDGSHSLGAAALADALVERGWGRRQGPITDAHREADGIRKAADHLRLMLNGGGRGKGLVWGLLDYADAVERAALEAARAEQ